MKKLWPTLVLVLVCAAGFWYGRANGWFASQKEETAAKPLFTIAADDITGATLDKGGETIELSKEGAEWKMKQPAAYPLNTYRPGSWVSSFSQLGYASIVEDKATDIAPYGLDKPTAQYAVKLADGTTYKLLVGNPLPIAGSSYVQIAGAPAVYEVSDTELKNLDVTPLELVDTRAVKAEYNDVQTVALTWKGEAWLLAKQEPEKTAYESTWKLDDKELTAPEGAGILDKLMTLYTDVLPVPVKEGDMSAPELTVKLGEKRDGKASDIVLFGKINGELVTLHTQGSPWGYTVGLDKIQGLYDFGKAGGKTESTSAQ